METHQADGAPVTIQGLLTGVQSDAKEQCPIPAVW